ncbi:hypothetical protein GF312_07515 [Candidatus Poribacteria bacterium]|nr:hypothetical protein [Candidatus Poribacteria bacterium]
MKLKISSCFCVFFLVIIFVNRVYPEPFEEKNPRDEKAILVPKGARPVLKEEYPRRRLVVDRIKARHEQVLSIPFSRSWNTAALTILNGLEIQETPEFEPAHFELGFALHSQRLKVGSLRNREYFQKETEGFPESWYRPLPTVEDINRPEGYMTTTFVHLAAKRMRNNYEDFIDFSDRISGILNVMATENDQLTFLARRDMWRYRTPDSAVMPKTRNTAGIYYKTSRKSLNVFDISGESVWSSLTDSRERELRYIQGIGRASWMRNLRSDYKFGLKTELQISTLRDNSVEPDPEVLETRSSASLGIVNIIMPASFMKIKLELSGLYDSDYEGYFTPGAEIALTPDVFKLNLGVRKKAVLPDQDELYWSSKTVRVNEELKPESFLEAYGSMDINLIARLRLLTEATYSRPESRITWQQLPDYIWEPVNIETSEALNAQGAVILDLIWGLGLFGGARYQYYDNQLFEPDIIGDAGIFYKTLSRDPSITLGAFYWTFTPLNNMDSPEDIIMPYCRIHATIRRAVKIFIDGRYALKDEDVLYYRGIPEVGRIISFGVNIVFGGLD